MLHEDKGFPPTMRFLLPWSICICDTFKKKKEVSFTSLKPKKNGICYMVREQRICDWLKGSNRAFLGYGYYWLIVVKSHPFQIYRKLCTTANMYSPRVIFNPIPKLLEVADIFSKRVFWRRRRSSEAREPSSFQQKDITYDF